MHVRVLAERRVGGAAGDHADTVLGRFRRGRDHRLGQGPGRGRIVAHHLAQRPLFLGHPGHVVIRSGRAQQRYRANPVGMAGRECERVQATVATNPTTAASSIAELREHGGEVVGRDRKGRHDFGGVRRRPAVAGPVDGDQAHARRGGEGGIRIEHPGAG